MFLILTIYDIFRVKFCMPSTMTELTMINSKYANWKWMYDFIFDGKSNVFAQSITVCVIFSVELCTTLISRLGQDWNVNMAMESRSSRTRLASFDWKWFIPYWRYFKNFNYPAIYFFAKKGNTLAHTSIEMGAGFNKNNPYRIKMLQIRLREREREIER